MNRPANDERPIFLVGFMGSGKSTVGRRLAERLGWEPVDTDERVVEREGRSIEEIFRVDGEAHFRRVEWETLQAFGAQPRRVVATGGGLFLAASRRRWMREHGTSFWLDLPLAACRERLPDGGGGRPLWGAAGDPVGLRAEFDRRRAAYALADVRLTAVGSPDQLVRALLEQLRAKTP